MNYVDISWLWFVCLLGMCILGVCMSGVWRMCTVHNSENQINKCQKEALKNVMLFLGKNNLDNPNLTGRIWGILNDENIQRSINYKQSQNLKENWSQDLVGKLQRTLVNYQLHQMKLGNPPELFAVIKNVFDKINQNSSVVDIGCSSGYYYEIINYYFPNKFSYSGCDYNKESIKLAKYYYPNVPFVMGDLTNMKYSNRAFDVSFLSGVIEHIPRYIQGINELCRITKKYIVLHRIWLTDKETECYKGTQFFVPIIRNNYNKNDFFKMFEQNSFRVVWISSTYDCNCNTYLIRRQY